MALAARFQVGVAECTAISDGTYRCPASMVFANLQPHQYATELGHRGQSPAQMEMPITCLLIETAGHRVLLDTGGGALVPGAGDLLQGLCARGLEPADIDTVVLSHAHGDHIGGALDDDGTPRYPNARYVLAKTEFEYWMSDRALAEMPFDTERKDRMRTAVRVILSSIRARLDLVEPGATLLDGLTVAAAPGHTPGQLVVKLSSQGHPLVFAADALLDPLDVEHPDACSVFDHDPRQTVITRRQLLERAAREGALVLVAHGPFPGLGRIRRDGKGFRWWAAGKQAAGDGYALYE